MDIVPDVAFVGGVLDVVADVGEHLMGGPAISGIKQLRRNTNHHIKWRDNLSDSGSVSSSRSNLGLCAVPTWSFDH